MAHHDDDRRVTLSLAETHPDGSILFQSWDVCACNLPWLREQLGEPGMESYSTREQVEATANAVKEVPGITFTGEDL